MIIRRLIFFSPLQIEMMVVRTIKPPTLQIALPPAAPSSGDWGADAGWDKNSGEPNWWVGTWAAAHQGWGVMDAARHKCGDTDYHGMVRAG